jgi:flagellin
LDQEFQQLKQEIVRVSEMHEWNGFPILNGKAGTPVGTPTTATTIRAGVAATATGKQLMTGDLEIQTDKGSFAIPASLAATDPKSNTIAAGSNNAGSAIAIAAAINSQVGVTGVSAVAGAATVAATKTTVGSTSIQTDLYVNGEKVSLSLSASHTLNQRRQYVMESINAGSTVHGVVAGDSGTGGLTLTTPDGRNLSVWYDSTSVQGTDFGLGLDTTPPSNPMGVTGIAGAAATSFGSPKTTAVDFPILTAGKKFSLNGLTFTAGSAGTTAAQTAAAFANLKSGMSAVAAAAANSTSAALGSFSGTFAEGFSTGDRSGTAVTATATSKGNVGDILVNAGVPTFVKTEGSGTATEKYDITFKPLLAGESAEINGLKFTATYNLTSTQVATAFSSIAANTTASTVTSNKAGTSALLGTFAGTFAAGWSTGSITGSTVTATSATANTDVTDIAISGNPQSATAPAISTVTPVAASTVYGTVTLNSNSTFTVKPGANAYAAGSVPAADPTYANFTALGFEAKTINPKNIGRLNFQVGPAANQLISIDLADFGKNGDITGPITSDRAPTNLLTVNSSNDVIMNVNKSLDRIAATRATMGAVMNRLEHVIDNLTNVVMNSEASRSQIEDADYAQASTELARTQIMQQAATAVLAQANTSQQTVLKLLQG